jgi:Ca-activated chloride channel family protein
MGIGDVTEGALLFRSGRTDRYIPAPILKTDVQIVVTGTIARATVTQEFTNPRTRKGDRLEGIYVFPLPETAAVDQLRMKVGERVIEGQIKERNEAKRTGEAGRHTNQPCGAGTPKYLHDLRGEHRTRGTHHRRDRVPGDRPI